MSRCSSYSLKADIARRLLSDGNAIKAVMVECLLRSSHHNKVEIDEFRFSPSANAFNAAGIETKTRKVD